MPERSSKIMYPANRRPIGVSVPSRLPTRAALAVVALAVIALLPTVALLGRLGLLTDPMVWASFVLVLGFLAVGLVTTVRRVGNPIGWLLLWQGVVAGLSLLGAAYGMYDLQVAAESLPGGSLLLWTSTWIWLAALAVSPVIHVLFPGRLLSRRWAGSSGWPGVDGAGHRGHRGRGLAAAGADAAGGTVLGPGVGSAAAPCPRRTGHVRGGRGRLLDRHGDPSAPSQGRRARADQVVPLRRQLRHLGHHPGNRPWGPDHHRVMARRNGGSLRDRGRALQVPPLRHRPADQPDPGLRAPHRAPWLNLRRCCAGPRAGVRRSRQQSPELGGSRRHPGRGQPVPTGPAPHSTDGGSPLQPPPLRRGQDDRGLQRPPA